MRKFGQINCYSHFVFSFFLFLIFFVLFLIRSDSAIVDTAKSNENISENKQDPIELE